MEEEAYLELREWSPLIDLLEKIPATRAKSLIQKDVINITCIHAVEEFIAVGTNVGSIYWYNRAKKDLKEFRCDVSWGNNRIRIPVNHKFSSFSLRLSPA